MPRAATATTISTTATGAPDVADGSLLRAAAMAGPAPAAMASPSPPPPAASSLGGPGGTIACAGVANLAVTRSTGRR